MPDRILVFSDWFAPGFRAGGPIRSLVNLTESVGLPFDIVTRNTDHHSETPYDLPTGRWIVHSAQVRVMYLSADQLSLSRIRSLMRGEYKRIYLNSLWSPRFTLLPLVVAGMLGKTHQVIIAPRGMLKSAALSIKSPKKKLLIFLLRVSGLISGIKWHATNLDEMNEVKQHFGSKARIHVAPNLPSVIEFALKPPRKLKGEIRLISIARISAEKGILEALEFLRSVQMLGDVQVDFYGTLQDEKFLEVCRQRAQELFPVRCFFHGELSPADIPHSMREAHFFYLPTRGENYGHAIVEALQYGRPVIISDRTPWRFGPDDAAGFSLPLDMTSFGDALIRCLDMDHDAYTIACKAAELHGKKIVCDPEVLSASRHIFD